MIRPYIHGDLLDLGCGNPVILEKFADAMDSYCGVEQSAEWVENISARFPNSRIYQRDLDRDPLDLDRRFDVVLMIALIVTF